MGRAVKDSPQVFVEPLVQIKNLFGLTFPIPCRAMREYGFASAPGAASRSPRTMNSSMGTPPLPARWGARMGERGPGDRPRSGRALVKVMEPADLRDRHHTPEGRGVHRPCPGRILLERLMRADGVVQVGNQTPIGSSPEKSGIRGTRGTAVPCGLIRPSSGVGSRCSSADLSRARGNGLLWSFIRRATP